MTSERDRLREFWNHRYVDFSLSESGWSGAGDGLNGAIYRCKTRALQRALGSLGRGPGDGAQARFSVLDAGCGQGYFAGWYRHHYPAVSYAGLDISERAVEHLRGAIPDREFYVADLCGWADPAGRRFDIVQSLEVLHLILDDELMSAAMANLSLHLKPGGFLLVTAVLPEQIQQPSSYMRYRSLSFWHDLTDRLGLRVAARRPMYYWLPSGGPANKYLRYALSRPGPGALYALDRLAFAAGLRPPSSVSLDCRMQLLTLTHV